MIKYQKRKEKKIETWRHPPKKNLRTKVKIKKQENPRTKNLTFQKKHTQKKKLYNRNNQRIEIQRDPYELTEY